MGVVEVERMAKRAVEQGRDRRRPGLGIAEHRGICRRRRAPGIRASSRATAWILRRAARGSHCQENRASEPWRAVLPRAGCPRIADRRHSRRAFRFHGPLRFLGVFLAVIAQGRRPDFGFKPPTRCGQQPCPMSSIRGVVCNISGNGRMTAFLKPLTNLIRPRKVQTGSGLQGHCGGRGRFRDRDGDTSKAAVMGGIDLPDRDPDERRAGR